MDFHKHDTTVTAKNDTIPNAEKKFAAMQHERVSNSVEQGFQGMTAPQSSTVQKPDCGEENYVGHCRMKGMKAVLTGGDSGIGRAVAIAFAREGADVAIMYKTHDEDAQVTASYVERAGCKCAIIKQDLSTGEASCKTAADRAVAELGRVDVLVLNHGVQFYEQSLEEISVQNVESTFQTNVFACVYLTKALAPAMPSGGSIVLTSSINASRGHDTLVSYSASKGAMKSLCKSLAKVLKDKKIRVNCVAPGPIWTPFITGSFPTKKVQQFGESNPTGRAGQPVEVAPAFVYLASSESTYVTGTTIHVDGGL